MARGSSSGESDYHIVAVRSRVTGNGSLLFSLEDYSQIQTQNLQPLTLQAATRFEPLVLSNFQSQRTRLIGQVVNLGEWFEFNRLIIFAKPVAEEYPQ